MLDRIVFSHVGREKLSLVEVEDLYSTARIHEVVFASRVADMIVFARWNKPINGLPALIQPILHVQILKQRKSNYESYVQRLFLPGRKS